jgi:hypothetical protein
MKINFGLLALGTANDSCCKFVKVDTEGTKGELDGLYERSSSKNKWGAPLYLQVDEYGDRLSGKTLISHRPAINKWVYTRNVNPTGFGWATTHYVECFEDAAPKADCTFLKKNRSANTCPNSETPHVQPTCYVPLEKFTLPVCGNQCKTYGDTQSVCHEKQNGGHSCTCGDSYKSLAGECIDKNECSINSRTCKYANCLNFDGGYECAGETKELWSGVYETPSGEVKQIEFEGTFLPKASGKGKIAGQKFTINESSTKVQDGEDHSEAVLKFNRVNEDGTATNSDLKIKIGDDITGVLMDTMDNHTGFIALNKDTTDQENHNRAKTPNTYTVKSGPGVYGTRTELTGIMEDLVFHQGVSGHGTDEYGAFFYELISNKKKNGNQISTLLKKYADFDIEMVSTSPYPTRESFEGTVTWEVKRGHDILGGQQSGQYVFLAAVDDGAGGAEGLVTEPTRASFVQRWQTTMDGEEMDTVISMQCENFKRFPEISASCDSNYGHVQLQGQGPTPVENNVPYDVYMIFDDFQCIKTTQRNNIGNEISEKIMRVTCTNHWGDGTGELLGGTKADVSKYQLTPNSVNSRGVITIPKSATNSKKKYLIINSKTDQVHFPVSSGTGTDDFQGDHTIIQLKPSSPSGERVVKLAYKNGEWAKYTYKLEIDGDVVKMKGTYENSLGDVGTFNEKGTREKDEEQKAMEALQTEHTYEIMRYLKNVSGDEQFLNSETLTAVLYPKMIGTGVTHNHNGELQGNFELESENPDIVFDDNNNRVAVARSSKTYEDGHTVATITRTPFPPNSAGMITFEEVVTRPDGTKFTQEGFLRYGRRADPDESMDMASNYFGTYNAKLKTTISDNIIEATLSGISQPAGDDGEIIYRGPAYSGNEEGVISMTTLAGDPLESWTMYFDTASICTVNKKPTCTATNDHIGTLTYECNTGNGEAVYYESI